jgi:DNA-binding CsgD family transcriptional regulator
MGPLTGSTDREAVAVVFIADPERNNTTAVEFLQTLYALTPAEAELVALLASGRSLEEAALERGVTMNTVRSQLKHVFVKTDTRRQGELVRLVLSGLAGIQDES